jgi:hypothetical protein
LWPCIGLTKSLGCFLGVFGQNGLEMRFFGEKRNTPFFQPPQWLDFGLKQATHRFFFNI